MAKITEILTRLGLWQRTEPLAAAAANENAPVPTRSITLRALMQERQGEDESLESLLRPEAWDIPDSLVFEHVQPQGLPEGWTSERLVGLLKQEELALPSEAARARALLRIAEEGLSAKSLLLDAGRRDEALDLAEESLKKRLERLEHEAERRRAWLEEQMRKLQEDRAQLDRAVRDARQRHDAWVAAKRSREDDLVQLVEMLKKAADEETVELSRTAPPPDPAAPSGPSGPPDPPAPEEGTPQKKDG